MLRLPDWYNWRAPDISRVFSDRVERLNRIRAEPSCLPALKLFYRDNPAQFICDWGCTEDPRNVEIGLPALLPLLLYPKQVDWIDFILDCWRSRRRGLTEKAREVGITWTAVALSCTLCLFYEGMSIGFGSRKEEYVDKLGDPKAILPKARAFMRLLPREFRGGWDISKHAPFMRIIFPESGSIIAGESGEVEVGFESERVDGFPAF